jgi:transcriptional regulator with PAS, ATPase and Fis domain
MFREDLFYRLNVIKIELPLLKERKEDVPLLVKHFLDTYSKENEKEILGVTDDVMEILMSCDWPGNIRELENLIERAVVLTKSKLISRENLPPFLLASQEETRAVASVNNELNLKENIQTFQKKAIISALKQAKGIQKKAANLLGVKPTTLNEMIKRLNIDISNLR